MRREQARLIDAAADPYDVLLDDYEKGVTAARLDEVFAEVWGGERQRGRMADVRRRMRRRSRDENEDGGRLSKGMAGIDRSSRRPPRRARSALPAGSALPAPPHPSPVGPTPTRPHQKVRAGLAPLIADLKANGTRPDDSWLAGEFAEGAQAALCREVALDMGFDLGKGRLDVSVHPFTGGAHPSDVRMTTRFKAGDLTEGLTGASSLWVCVLDVTSERGRLRGGKRKHTLSLACPITQLSRSINCAQTTHYTNTNTKQSQKGAVHETGHALYEQGRNLSDEWRDLPVNAALSMGVHESQSLLWERMVALSPAFAGYVLGKVCGRGERERKRRGGV